jgi:integrase
MTVAGLVRVFLSDPEQAALRSAAEKARRVNRNVLPIIGDVRLSQLRRRDVRNVIEPILRRGKATEAARVYEDLRAMLRWGVKADYLDRNPTEGTDKPAAGKPRERVLNDDEIRTLWTGLPRALARSKQCQRVIRLCLFTAARVSEVSEIEVAELDLDKAEWLLPGRRSKNGHPYLVPLTPTALAVIHEALADGGGSKFLFPCGEGALSGAAVARTILRAHETEDDRPLGRFGIAPWSAHDLRRTVLTNLGRLGVPPHIVGAVANHRSVTKATITSLVYVQYSYESEKREALSLWADRLAAIVEGGRVANVISLRGRP